MTRAKLPGTMRNPYIADERARQSNEVLHGFIIFAIVLACSAGMVLFYLWLRDHAF